MTTRTSIKKHAITLGLSLMLLGLGQDNARALTSLPDVPLTVFSSAEHNVLLTFDDSGSMERGYMPDCVGGLGAGCVDLGPTRRGCASTVNTMAYNPAVAYVSPPVRTSPGNLSATAASLPNASFPAAWVNGFLASLVSPPPAVNAGGVVNLSTNYQPVWSLNVLSGAPAANTPATCGIAAAGVPAFYFVYDATLAGMSPHPTEGAAGTCPIPAVTTNQFCYRRVQHNNASAGGAWTAAQQTNFANWYSYYRVRNLAAKSAAGRAFQGLPTNVRVAGQHLNNASANATVGIQFTSTTSNNATNVLKRFCDDPANTDSLCKNGSLGRTEFFTRLYNSPADFGTPLRAAMRRAGESFGTTNDQSFSPYRAEPGGPASAANPELSCRKNFHIMMTDGFWNGVGGIGADRDSSTRTLGDGTTVYTPIAPYRETPALANTLADNAFEYWYRDLRPDLTNNVRATERDATGTDAQRYWNPRNNPAIWQHMQTFTIGLGVTGVRNPANYFNLTLPNNAGDWDELKSGALSWPNPLPTENGTRIDDLWHAAINSRGDYFSASDPTQLVGAFTQIIGQIGAESGSAAGLGASGTSTTTSSGSASLFQVAFETGRWGGKLISKRVDAEGVPDLVNWDAAVDGLNTQNFNTDRHIFTYNVAGALGARGLRFRWADLSAAQQAALNRNPSNVPDTDGEARLNYLRGASANEGAGLGFRTRPCFNRATLNLALNETAVIACATNAGKLGDIIDSSPVFVGKPVFDYPDTIESAPYSAFVTAQSSRTKMVYVGANDGMLHGFNSADGKEKMAYVPNMVYENITQNNLSLLASPFYSHRYYVNGTPTAGDVFIGTASPAWRTVLVGGMRKGGRGYYALDVTDPSSFTESAANANQLVKWEFTDPDMGFSFSQAVIFKMATGQWAAVFGNGYRLDNELAGTGRSMIFVVDIATGNLIQKIDTGVSGGGGTLTMPNGMSTPAVVDINDDYIADYIYAGDLFGKMWRIDVRSPNAADWGLAANVNPLFTATDPANIVQPITTQPSVGFHPAGFGGLMVYFGTGKYLENNDNATTGPQQTQSFYGIHDRGVSGRSTEPSKREATLMTRAALLQQTISTSGAAGSFSLRNVTNYPINWRLDQVSTNTHLGWYVNFDQLPVGERQVTDSLLREGRIIFTTLIPDADACNPGGTGWLMVLNTENGGQLKETFDTNGDGVFTDADNPGNTYGAAGAKPTGGGSLSAPIVLTHPPGPGGANPACKETVESVDSNGVILPMKLTCKPAGRESWNKIR